MGQKIDFCLKWSKSVQMGPKGSQIVKKISSSTNSDPFEPLWNVDKPAMFGLFCLFFGAFLWIPCIVNMQYILSQFVFLVAPTSKDPREYAKYKAEYDAYSDW